MNNTYQEKLIDMRRYASKPCNVSFIKCKIEGRHEIYGTNMNKLAVSQYTLSVFCRVS